MFVFASCLNIHDYSLYTVCVLIFTLSVAPCVRTRTKMSDSFTFPSSLHLVLSRLHHRWPARDTSTSLCATPRPCSPWRSPTISGRCWRRTWSGRSTRRTRCRCRTLMKTWPTYRRGRTARRTPTARAMFINVSLKTTHTLTHPLTHAHTHTHTHTHLPRLLHRYTWDCRVLEFTVAPGIRLNTHTHAAELPFSLRLSHRNTSSFSALSDVRSRMESALYGQERSGVDLPGARHVVGFLNRCLCLYINMEIILFFLMILEHVAFPLPSPRRDRTRTRLIHAVTHRLNL